MFPEQIPLSNYNFNTVKYAWHVIDSPIVPRPLKSQLFPCATQFQTARSDEFTFPCPSVLPHTKSKDTSIHTNGCVFVIPYQVLPWVKSSWLTFPKTCDTAF